MKLAMLTVIGAMLWTTGAWATDQTLTGTISDKMCGVSHAGMGTKMTDRECTQMCAAKGAQYVLVSEGKVYKLMNHDSDLKAHAGHVVNLTGDLKGDTIRVANIEMPKSSK
jgi:hypothetical protein